MTGPLTEAGAGFLPWGLLPLAILFPLAVATLWPVPRLRGLMVRLAPWAALPALILSLLPGMEGAGVTLPAVATGMGLAVDGTGLVFLRLTSLLWVAAGAFAARYHAADPHRARFLGFFALTMAGNLGLTVAADALTFYLFFAAMTFAAYGLVVHERSPGSQRAGRVYIVLALVGEVLLLAGLMTLGSRAGGLGAPELGFGAELAAAWSELESGVRGGGWVAALLVAGFGVKAGLAPLHLWLPLAHPVAPTAASALLSGVMIKAGLLGWLRFLPLHLSLPEVGGALLALGAATALYGVLAGLPQEDPKTVLAYSSVSQMGHLAMGTGILLLEPRAAPVALAAVLLHAMHHGVAKGALFLGVGVGDRSPWLRGPLLLATLAPALALAGAPFTSGSLAKGLLKDALGAVEGAWYPVLDPYLWLASTGTALLLARFAWTWRRRMEEKARPPAPTEAPPERPGAGMPPPSPAPLPWGLVLPWGGLVALGLLAPFWLPVLAPLPEAAPHPGWTRDLAASLFPVVLAAALTWAALRGGWRVPERLRIPPGDLLLPVSRLVTLVHPGHLRHRLAGEEGGDPEAPEASSGRIPGAEGGEALRGVGSRGEGSRGEGPFARWLERGTLGDLRTIRGASLGVLLLGLAALLASLVLVGG